jgi:hypothetical protein
MLNRHLWPWPLKSSLVCHWYRQVERVNQHLVWMLIRRVNPFNHQAVAVENSPEECLWNTPADIYAHTHTHITYLYSTFIFLLLYDSSSPWFLFSRCRCTIKKKAQKKTKQHANIITKHMKKFSVCLSVCLSVLLSHCLGHFVSVNTYTQISFLVYCVCFLLISLFAAFIVYFEEFRKKKQKTSN